MMSNILKNNWITIIYWITVLSLFLGCLLSIQLWAGTHLFPSIPIFDGLTTIPSSILFYSWCISASVNLFKPHKALFIGNLFILIVLIAQDQNRLQPWIYIYLLFLIPICLSPFITLSDAELLTIFKIILIGLYFWSGLQKINDNFINEGFQTILIHCFQIKKEALIQTLHPIGYLIPFIEISISIGFLTATYRNIALVFAILTHLFVIFYLWTMKHNLVVIPWNFSMICLDIIVFTHKQTENSFTNIRNQFRSFLIPIYLFMVGIMPIFNWNGYFDDYLSFSLYSQKNKLFYIAISDKYLNLLNHQFDDYFVKMGADLSGGHLIDVNKWAFKELNVPVYPEYRIFKKISYDFCKYNIPSTDLIFLVYKQPISTKNLVKWNCSK
jgi:hypothetical protein